MSVLLFPHSSALQLGEMPDDDEAAKIRAYIERFQRDDETWSDAVARFADMVYRDRSTVWRWLSGERRVPKSVWDRLPIDDVEGT